MGKKSRRNRKKEERPTTAPPLSEEEAKKREAQRQLMATKIELWQTTSPCKQELLWLKETFPAVEFVNLSSNFNVRNAPDYLYGHKEDPKVHFFLNGLMTEWFFVLHKMEHIKYCFIYKAELLPVDTLKKELLQGFLGFATAHCGHCVESAKQCRFIADCGTYLCQKHIFLGCPCGCLPSAEKMKPPEEGEKMAPADAVPSKLAPGEEETKGEIEEPIPEVKVSVPTLEEEI